MIPVMQTILNFKNGNCMQACIASIMEIDLDDLPNFMGKGTKEYYNEMRKYFDGLNINCISIHPDYEEKIKDHYAIAVGISPRNKKENHAVVWLNGSVVHDPYPNGGGIIGKPKCFYVFTVKNPVKRINATLPYIGKHVEEYVAWAHKQ